MLAMKLPRERKEEMIASLISYYERERSESLGNLEAELLVDFMLSEFGPFLYNQALSDVRAFMSKKAEQLEDELYAMEVSTRSAKRRN
ncbi:DUF2164 domain-containing protein [Paenibacillus soyae]|uniref:DUF2164 domain-containing protein n=1 Tax=Paenibacillus soyae TaxID=2969249 RepID=A0A9X2MJ54_9BACL|nr:DUF2164 domain-containing protein [Paenibacillus soyae]MCR2802783.1 DUF2164 domain-containing protein [Paenibacillus soyae]